jgi:chromosome segregation ATPase
MIKQKIEGLLFHTASADDLPQLVEWCAHYVEDYELIKDRCAYYREECIELKKKLREHDSNAKETIHKLTKKFKEAEDVKKALNRAHADNCTLKKRLAETLEELALTHLMVNTRDEANAILIAKGEAMGEELTRARRKEEVQAKLIASLRASLDDFKSQQERNKLLVRELQEANEFGLTELRGRWEVLRHICGVQAQMLQSRGVVDIFSDAEFIKLMATGKEK